MKKPYLIALVSTMIAIVAFWLLSQPPHLFATSSPNHTYTVEFRGDKSSPRFPFIENQVSFNVFNRGERLIKNGYAHSGDWFDESFELAYPEHVWVNENTLRFGIDLKTSERERDTLSLTNNSGKVIKYLKIKARDMFLVFNIQPGSALTLTASRQSYLSWIEGEGEFIDGERISWNGVNFPLGDTLVGPVQYCISVNHRGLRIQSPQVEGYYAKSSRKDPNVPKAENCDP